MKLIQRTHGLALAVILLVIPVMLVLGFGLASLGIGNLNSADAARTSKQALFVGEAGVHRALRELAKDSTWDGGFTGVEMTNSSDTYTVVVTNNSAGTDFVTAPNGARVPRGTVYIHSTGTARGGAATRQVGALVTPGDDKSPFLPYASFTDLGIVIPGGQLTTDSFDSRIGDPPTTYPDTRAASDGDLGTNFPETADQSGSTAVDMKGAKIEINGVIDVGPSGTAGPPTISGGGSYQGATVLPDTISFPEVVPPTGTPVALPRYTSGTHTLVPGHYDQLDVGGNATVTLTGGTYVIQDVKLSARLDIQNGPVILYVTGTLDIGGNAGINDNTQSAPDFRVLCTDDVTDVKINGVSGAYLLLYGRMADVTIGGTSDLYGAVVCRTLRVPGAAAIHYDKAVDDLFTEGGNGGPEVISWQRI